MAEPLAVTPCGRLSLSGSFHFTPRSPDAAAAPRDGTGCLAELEVMFPSWDAAALAAVLEANGNDAAATVMQLLAWTAEDEAHAPALPPVPAGAVGVVVPAGAAAGTSLRLSAEGRAFAVTVPPGLEAGEFFIATIPPPAADAALAAALAASALEAAPASEAAAAPPILPRTTYDDVLARRLAATLAPEATGSFLKAVAALKRRAARARETVRVSPPPSPKSSPIARREKHAPASREDRIVAGQKLLAQRLALLKLTSVAMDDDGNCQFRAVSQELFNTQAHHALVRRTIVAYLRAHEADFSAFVEDAWGDYASKMARDAAWGDELTLQAACAAYDVEIHLISSEHDNFHLHYEPPTPRSGRRRLFLSYIAPIHYNVVAPTR